MIDGMGQPVYNISKLGRYGLSAPMPGMYYVQEYLKEEQVEFEIDLWDLMRFLKKKLAVILAVTLCCAAVGWGISAMVLKPQYTASTRVYVLNRSNENSIVYSDIQISTYVSYDFEVLITGPNVTREVISRLGLDMTDAQVAGRIDVLPLEGTRVLQIDFTHEDPKMAAQIANCVRDVAAEQIRGFVDADAVKTVYEADVPRHPSSPNVGRNTLLAALLGAFAVVAAYAVVFILDDTIRTEEDVERYLGLSVLGLIPESQELNYETAPAVRRGSKRRAGR